MIKRISLHSLRGPGNIRDPSSGKVVQYSACAARDMSDSMRDDDDLDEVAVISNATPDAVKYGSSGSHPHANGPRLVPGIVTAGVDRSRVITGALPPSKRPSVVIAQSTGSMITSDSCTPAVQPLHQAPSSAMLPTHHTTHIPVSPPTQATTTLENGKSVTIKTGSGPHYMHHPPPHHHHHPIGRNIEAMEISKKTRDLRRKEIRKEFEKWETSSSSRRHGCNWSFVFDPSGRLCYYWSLIVSIAFLYNFWTVIYRCAFQEINAKTVVTWFALDYFADFIYVLDIAVNFRTGYLEEGVLQTDSLKLRQHYMNCTLFYVDCLCLLPLDFLYLSIGFKSILRCFRLVKIYRFWAFLDRTERHTNYPNVFRTLSLMHYILVIFHWNACLSHIIHVKDGFGSRDWFTRARSKTDCIGVTCDYLHALYWSVLAFTTVGDLPMPRTKSEYAFLIMQIVFGLFLFATVLGHVANIVTNVSAARKEFQAKLDAVKTYMRMRRVPDHIQTKVIRWFDYLWMTQKSSDEERSVGCLPSKLKAEIAIHVHLDTLKRVEIFQNTEAGFLCELVLRLRPVLFSPGDYICRKGEVGKEMYIVNRGRLQVVTDNGKTVLATLRAGSYFGEISILNMGTAGNRRTASVRSVGYSDLFCLNKQDMWDVLKDYPAARVRLEAIAVKRLEKYRKEPLKKIAMGRSRSTPGLVESKGKLVGKTPDGREKTSASSATLLTDGTEEAGPDGEFQDAIDLSTASTLRKPELEEPCDSAGRKPSIAGHQTPILSGSPAVIYASQSPHLLPPGVALLNFGGGDNRNNTFPIFSPFTCAGLSPAVSTQAIPTVQTEMVGGESANFVGSSCLHPHSGQGGQSQSTSQQNQDALLAEIKRLRERLLTLETENASMSMKLNRQQWQVENRLAEIEMQICNQSGNTSLAQGQPTSGIHVHHQHSTSGSLIQPPTGSSSIASNGSSGGAGSALEEFERNKESMI